VKKYALAILPLALGSALFAVCESGLLANPIVYLRADMGTVFLLLGLTASALSALGVGILDVSRRHCQQSLDQYQQEQAEAHRRFVRRLDHELKNPLTAIRAALANLTDEGEDSALTSVRAQVDRLARLSADLRKLADLETQPIEREQVNLAELLSELLELVKQRPEARARDLRLSLPQAPWPLPPVAGDSDLLFLALHNLVDNALKFSCEGDTVEIRAFEDGSSVVVEVADTGPGVSEDELPHLGEELYRGSGARAIGGSGLGLALARAIVTRHSGTLAIRSRLAEGTVVTMRLPCR